jgi:putative tricarboxylic transport membrane protein
VFLMLFAASGAAFIVRASRAMRFELPAGRATTLAVAALLILPLLFPVIGFVLTSTLLFAAVAHALDTPTSWKGLNRIVVNVALGFLFSAVLFVMFGRGLGVFLPPTPGLGGLL